MCDTMIAMGGITASGRTMLAKNSDREPNEAQYLTHTPAASHPAGAMVKATYVEIPQVAQTYAHIGSRPWWMWGFEHGVNEHGLAIANEAEWSRLPAGRDDGLLGMDLLRLTLERARDADEGLDVLIALIETWGQSGRGSTHREMFYHNAFILADAAKAWVLETAGRHWVARRVTDWAAISNVYSIGQAFDRISPGAIAFATAQGWHDPASPFDWAASFNDPDRPAFPYCAARLQMSRAGMAGLAAGAAQARPATLEAMFARLRDHGDTPEGWRPAKDAQGMVCMHAHAAHEGSETVAAMVAELGAGADPVIWSGLCSPCLSAFIPVWIGAALPEGWTQPDPGGPDAWWDMERLQRLAERDHAAAAPLLRSAFDAIEADAVKGAAALPADAPAAQRSELTRSLAAAQAGLVQAMTARIEDLWRSTPPRAEDPRGTYLHKVALSVPDTSARRL